MGVFVSANFVPAVQHSDSAWILKSQKDIEIKMFERAMGQF